MHQELVAVVLHHWIEPLPDLRLELIGREHILFSPVALEDLSEKHRQGI